jgi:ankyrin repeat protein
MVNLLLDSGAATHRRSGLKQPPLHAAVLSGDSAMLELLLENGAAVDCRSDQGDTALMAALKNGKEDAVELLLRHGADPKAVSDLGQTTLICAALFARDAEYEEHEKAVRVLERIVPLGIPSNAKDHAGKTALDYANDGYEKDAAKFLKAKTAKSAKQGGITRRKQ